MPQDFSSCYIRFFFKKIKCYEICFQRKNFDHSLDYKLEIKKKFKI